MDVREGEQFMHVQGAWPGKGRCHERVPFTDKTAFNMIEETRMRRKLYIIS